MDNYDKKKREYNRAWIAKHPNYNSQYQKRKRQRELFESKISKYLRASIILLDEKDNILGYSNY